MTHEDQVIAKVSIEKQAGGEAFEARMGVPGSCGQIVVRDLSREQADNLQNLLNAALRQTVRNTQNAIQISLGIKSS